MADQSMTAPSVATHGTARLPAVEVHSYNVELKDDDGLVGDRANKRAFRAILERWRKPLRKAGSDPFGGEPSEDINRKKLDALLSEGDPEAAGVVQNAIEDFAQEFALVIRRFLKLKAWRDTERIVVGGGFRASEIGELTIGRAGALLKSDKMPIDLLPIRNEPDAAGLIGAGHLVPGWMFEAHDAILAVDIGGTNIRAGVVALNLEKASDLSEAFVWKLQRWRYADEKKRHARRCGRDADRDAHEPDRPLGQRATALWRHSSASAVQESSRRTARSRAEHRICRATGRARASTCRSRCVKRFRPSPNTRR
jgi:hypothetical protein